MKVLPYDKFLRSVHYFEQLYFSRHVYVTLFRIFILIWNMQFLVNLKHSTDSRLSLVNTVAQCLCHYKARSNFKQFFLVQILYCSLSRGLAKHLGVIGVFVTYSDWIFFNKIFQKLYLALVSSNTAVKCRACTTWVQRTARQFPALNFEGKDKRKTVVSQNRWKKIETFIEIC